MSGLSNHIDKDFYNKDIETQLIEYATYRGFQKELALICINKVLSLYNLNTVEEIEHSDYKGDIWDEYILFLDIESKE